MTPTNAITIPDTNEKAIDAVTRAQSISITTNEEYIAADRFCVNLKDLEKEVDEAYDEHISDAHAAHKSLVAKKKQYAEPIVEARRIIKSKMVAWQDAAEAKRKDDELRLRKEAEKMAKKNGTEAPVIVVPNSTPEAETSIQKRWDFRITDASVVPREYLMVDEVKLRKVVNALKSDTRIPGIEVFSKRV